MSRVVDDLRTLAGRLGWTETSGSRGTVTLHAPQPYGAVKIVLPANGQVRQSIERASVRKLLRYSDSLRLTEVLRGMEGDLAQRVGLRRAADMEGKPVSTPTAEKPSAPKPGPRSVPERVVVKEQPWLAHNGIGSSGVGMSYESKVVVERTWSDGTTDYRCVVEGCGYENKNPRSVKTHYGARKAGDHPNLVPYNRRELMADPAYTEPAFRREVPPPVDRLRREIQKALAVIWDDVTTGEYRREDLATRLAELMIEARPDRDDCGPRGPLSPEEILTRIRVLVADTSRTDALVKEQAETADRLAKLEHELVEARAANEELHQKWRTWRDMMDEEMGGETR
jgi:hypothetical protein